MNDPRPQSRYAFPIACVSIALLGILVLAPGARGGFLFDDQASILTNYVTHLTELDFESLLYAAYSYQPGSGSRPLSMLSFAFDHWRGGLDPLPYKVTNLIIHGATTLALSLLFRNLLQAAGYTARQCRIGAVCLAAAWAIHPLQASSVLYVVQRMQTLCTLFTVLALLHYMRMRHAQVEGLPSRRNALLTLLFWALAFASKEDAILLPAYAFIAEVTLLRYRAAHPELARMLRHGYHALALAGIVIYFALVVPRYWSWDNYPGRDFSSFERLLTQARVLMMYIGQVLLPSPHQLRFFYDDLTVSRGLLEPWTTLPSILAIAMLVTLAWRSRTARPLTAFGILFFFAGHFVTSNVVNLEMAFEHRNHLPMIGIILVVGDTAVAYGLHRRRVGRVAGTAVLIALAATALVRAQTWADPLTLAKTTLEYAPRSERAWMLLNAAYSDRSRMKPGPYLDLAIETSREGALATGSPPLLSNVVIYKTIRGDVTREDWARLLWSLEHATMSAQNHNIVWTMVGNARRKLPLDQEGVLRTIEIIAARSEFTTNEYLQLAAYIHNDTDQPGRALPLLRRAVGTADADDPDIDAMFRDLATAGRHDWIRELRSLAPVTSSHPRAGRPDN